MSDYSNVLRKVIEIQDDISNNKIHLAINELKLLLDNTELLSNIYLQKLEKIEIKLNNIREQEYKFDANPNASNNISRLVTDIMFLSNSILRDLKANIHLESNNVLAENNTEFSTILYLGSSPYDRDRLNTHKEIRQLQEIFNESNTRSKKTFISRIGVRVEDFENALLEFRPSILHFSGHGNRNGIYLMDDFSNSYELSSEALISMIKVFSKSIQVVFLNSCYSYILSSELSLFIPYVIGMNDQVPDIAAIQFSKSFYKSIDHGLSVESAFEMGISSLLSYRLESNHIPTLKINPNAGR